MRVTLLTALFVLSASTASTARTLVHAGHLIDGISDKVRDNVTIVIDDGRITDVHDGFTATTGDDELIDLSTQTVLPGLMDMHVHLTGILTRTSYLDEFVLNPTDNVLAAAYWARITLLAGFTTVRNLGDDGLSTVSLRNSIRQGQSVGPRIYTAGKSLATTGGHADPTSGWCEALQGDPGPRDGVINSADDARKAVRQRYKDGADMIKITATGGVLSMAANGQNAQFTDAELEAVVATANDYGFPVAAHAHGAEGMLRAVRAGVASIEHGSYMTEDVRTLMKKKGTYYVPTLLAGVTVTEMAEMDDFLPPIVRPKAREIGPVLEGTFQKAYQAGVPIAFGTDSGVSKHGENAREFELMVQYGMPPMKAIQSATIHGARLVRNQQNLGSVEKGKLADLIAVDGDPLQNISLLRDVRFVMKEGVVYKRDGEPVAR
jgi:imidazolonepropionase-like amidohydrolase